MSLDDYLPTRYFPIEPPSPRGKHAVVLFDGVCNLCNGFVNFVIDRDPQGYFRFGALQSEAAQAYLKAFAKEESGGKEGAGGGLNSVVLIERGKLYVRSTAALRILWRLGAPWSLMYALTAVPCPLRDRVYRCVAAYRYDWFGERSECRVPTPELRGRFIGAGENGAPKANTTLAGEDA